jgi:hypothetical protein
MHRIARVIIVLIAVSLLIALSCRAMIWEGCFETAEFQITFVNEDGEPLKGVSLRVLDETRHESFHFPVTDFSPQKEPCSDNAGVVTFHHITTRATEFSGRCRYCLFVIPITNQGCKPPQFTCCFFHHGQQMCELSFEALNDEAMKQVNCLEKTITWNWPKYLSPDFPLRLRPEDASPHPITFRVVRKQFIVREE